MSSKNPNEFRFRPKLGTTPIRPRCQIFSLVADNADNSGEGGERLERTDGRRVQTERAPGIAENHIDTDCRINGLMIGRTESVSRPQSAPLQIFPDLNEPCIDLAGDAARRNLGQEDLRTCVDFGPGPTVLNYSNAQSNKGFTPPIQIRVVGSCSTGPNTHSNGSSDCNASGGPALERKNSHFVELPSEDELSEEKRVIVPVMETLAQNLLIEKFKGVSFKRNAEDSCSRFVKKARITAGGLSNADLADDDTVSDGFSPPAKENSKVVRRKAVEKIRRGKKELCRKLETRNLWISLFSRVMLNLECFSLILLRLCLQGVVVIVPKQPHGPNESNFLELSGLGGGLDKKCIF